MATTKQGGFYGSIFTLTFSAITILCFLIQPTTAWPIVSVEEFTVDNLGNKSAEEHTITYEFNFENQFRRQVIYLDDINVNFFHMHENDKLYIGKAKFSGFRLSSFRNVHRAGKFEPEKKLGLNNSTSTEEIFRVEIDTTFRHAILFFFRGPRLHVKEGADLKVDYRGALENKDELHVMSNAIKNTLLSPFKMGGILLGVLFFLSM